MLFRHYEFVDTLLPFYLLINANRNRTAQSWNRTNKQTNKKQINPSITYTRIRILAHSFRYVDRFNRPNKNEEHFHQIKNESTKHMLTCFSLSDRLTALGTAWTHESASFSSIKPRIASPPKSCAVMCGSFKNSFGINGNSSE